MRLPLNQQVLAAYEGFQAQATQPGKSPHKRQQSLAFDASPEPISLPEISIPSMLGQLKSIPVVASEFVGISFPIDRLNQHVSPVYRGL